MTTREQKKQHTKRTRRERRKWGRLWPVTRSSWLPELPDAGDVWVVERKRE